MLDLRNKILILKQFSIFFFIRYKFYSNLIKIYMYVKFFHCNFNPDPYPSLHYAKNELWLKWSPSNLKCRVPFLIELQTLILLPFLFYFHLICSLRYSFLSCNPDHLYVSWHFCVARSGIQQPINKFGNHNFLGLFPLSSDSPQP